MEKVDDQLERLERYVRDELDFELSVHVPRRYWDQMNELDTGTKEKIKTTLRDVFGSFIFMYSCTIVETILVQCRDILVQVVWAAMNVPYPLDSDEHIQRVIRNAHDVYVELIYARLRTEMIMSNHNAEVIQRTWRKVIADPSYLVCRQRLLNEFNELSEKMYTQNVIQTYGGNARSDSPA